MSGRTARTEGRPGAGARLPISSENPMRCANPYYNRPRRYEQNGWSENRVGGSRSRGDTLLFSVAALAKRRGNRRVLA